MWTKGKLQEWFGKKENSQYKEKRQWEGKIMGSKIQ
jgi:hypothetical protein